MKPSKDIIELAFKRHNAICPYLNTIYVNVPKNNDNLSMVEAIVECVHQTKEDVLFIATTELVYTQFCLAGIDTVYLYDIVKYNQDTNKLYIDKMIDSSHSIIVLQSSDNMTTELLNDITKNVHHTSSVFLLYDSLYIKHYLGNEIAKTIWLYNNYEIAKTDRDKNNTELDIYNLRNDIRKKSFRLREFIDEKVSKPPHIYITHGKYLDLENYLNINIPIITPHRSLMIELNNQIRRQLNLDDNTDCVPKVGEILALYKPAVAKDIYSDKEFVLPLGYRFKIQDIERQNIVNSMNEPISEYLTVTFEHTDVTTGEIYTVKLNISLSYIEYLSLGYNTFPDVCNLALAYYGYVLGYWMLSDHTFNEAMVIYNSELSDNKNELYSCLCPIYKTVHFVFL